MQPEEPAVSELTRRPPDGPFLRHHRELAGLSLTAVALQAGISKGYLSKIETGKTTPPLSLVIGIADAIAEASTAGAA